MRRLVSKLIAVAALLAAPLSAFVVPLSAMAQDGLERLPDDTRPMRYTLSVTPDAAWARFSGNGTLEFEVVKPTATVVVNADGLDIGKAVLDGRVAARIGYDKQRQRAMFTFPQPLATGTHRIDLSWTAAIGRNVEGVFKVDYPTSSGTNRQMLFTHLCCIGTARKFAPLWDQPDLKAVFDIDVAAPAGDTVISNMPAERKEPIAAGGTRFHFAPTPKMSSYLLFFSVGAFDRITERVGPTEIGVALQQGKGEKGRFALATSAQSLGYFNEYFAYPYPLPKLDAIGMPGGGNFGAMENWGAVFYFEPYILVDPALSTEQDRQRVYEVVAHENAHQWFGNLVTMRWWDDLWLNEGFASWMAVKTMDRFRPEWQPWLRAVDSREAAFRLDGRSSTHPIIRPVKTMEEAELAFDEITYEKGSQVIRMIEAWVGEDAFRTAIRAHVRDHAYANAVTSDLWRALSAASSLPIGPIVRDFTEQEGVPMIDVVSTRCAPSGDRTLVTLKQGRFGLDPQSRTDKLWHVPVTVQRAGTGEIARQIVRGPQPVEVAVAGCGGAVKVNVRETAYFRTRYDDASFDALSRHFDALPAADRLGLLNDSYGLAEGGYGGFSRYLDLAARVGADADPLLQLATVRKAGALDRLYAGLPGRAAFRAHVHKRLGPVLARLGWADKPGEPANTGLLREALVNLLATTGDAAVIAEARRRFGDPAGANRKVVVMAVGAGADATGFATLARRAAKATDSAERELYLLALANANDPAIATRVMELALSDVVPEQLFSTLFVTIAERHPELVFDFVTTRFDALAPRLNAFERAGFVSLIADKGVDVKLAEKLASFMKARFAGEGKETSERARATILYRDGVRRQSLPQVDAWLKVHP